MVNLRDDFRLYKLAYQHDRIGKAFVDRQGRLSDANPALCGMLRLGPEELAGRTVPDLFPDLPWREPLEPLSAKCRYEPPAGEPRWLHVHLTLLEDGERHVGGRSAAGILQVEDLSAAVHLEEEIRRLKRDADTLGRAEHMLQSEKLAAAGQLAAGIAHEIRNPLTSLKGFLQLLKSGSSSAAKRDAYLTIMLEELGRIEQILGELLVLSRPSSVQYAKTRIAQLIRHVVLLLQPQAVMRGVEIAVRPISETAYIYCDENQIKQVLINIVKNGIEAMENGGTLSIEAAADQETAAIRIADQGIGIPPDKLDRLGSPFFTTKENGTGLGLTVCYRIIRNHGGRIEVESRQGEGTTFTLYLPVEGRPPDKSRDAPV
ncbi:Sporulation kinase A [Thermobacillus xylanilyticus]|uniref:histidine kinase n=1 Tax=Thermobacillus xylanilyticus TaxID=76633 RepID=A0ABM8V4A2_THEXY|nr:ATP-binding protein [Thermobacillus xylanilyticus]CAG5086346.1 Sporulation kinase A [Thermobacillus xylanilyticus]